MTADVTDLQIIEGILFSSPVPVKAQALREILAQRNPGITPEQTAALIDALRTAYQETGRAMRIDEIAGGYVINTLPALAVWIQRYNSDHVTERLSSSTFETLSIVAYKQPITRAEIELIRGVNCGGILQHLLDKGLIRISGRKEIPGRPFLYATTKKFLEYFRLKSIHDLPELRPTDRSLQ